MLGSGLKYKGFLVHFLYYKSLECPKTIGIQDCWFNWSHLCVLMALGRKKAPGRTLLHSASVYPPIIIHKLKAIVHLNKWIRFLVALCSRCNSAVNDKTGNTFMWWRTIKTEKLKVVVMKTVAFNVNTTFDWFSSTNIPHERTTIH